jgi:hypothetical protein
MKISDNRFRHAVLQFRYNPNLETFSVVHNYFEYLVASTLEQVDVDIDQKCLIGHLFGFIGQYKQGSAFNFFITKLLKHFRKIYAERKYCD